MPIRFPWEELCPMTVFILPPRSLSGLRLTARFLPFSSEASLLLASSEPPSFAFAAIRGGFSSLSLSALYGMRVHRLAPFQKQASCLLLSGRLRSLSPPSMAAFLRYRSALSSGGESTTRLPPTALPKYSRSPATLRFCRLVSEKNHQKSPRSLKVRQTPRSLSDLRLTARFLPFFPATALPKYSRSPATLRFCRLVSEKNHQKSPRSLKVRQTPSMPINVEWGVPELCRKAPLSRWRPLRHTVV